MINTKKCRLEFISLLNDMFKINDKNYHKEIMKKLNSLNKYINNEYFYDQELPKISHQFIEKLCDDLAEMSLYESLIDSYEDFEANQYGREQGRNNPNADSRILVDKYRPNGLLISIRMCYNKHMSFIRKYILFHVLIFLVPLFIVLLINDDTDACLDSGYCKEGLSLNVHGKEIIINEQTCKDNNGIWHSDKKVCQFK